MHNEFPLLPEDVIKSLFTKDDIYHTDSTVREHWKYASSHDVAGTPTASVNGVKLDNYPDEDGWKEIISELLPASAVDSIFFQ